MVDLPQIPEKNLLAFNFFIYFVQLKSIKSKYKVTNNVGKEK